jgi:PAS domain S-box-containing protein
VYKLQDIIDIKHFQALQDQLNKIYSFPSAIIDNDGNILTATAWQDICTRFHRKNAECEKECIKSDQYILSHLHEANPAVSYRCPHGLVDNATPIIIDGVHYGNFFTGQFFLEKPDLEFFRLQAARYGFDETAYLDAVKKVPIWSREQLDNYLSFIRGLISTISESGLKNLKENENRKKIEESERRSGTILAQMHDGFWAYTPDRKIVDVNDAICLMTGYSRAELLSMGLADIVASDSPTQIRDRVSRIMKTGSDQFEAVIRRKDGGLIDVEVSISYLRDQNLFYSFHHDITQRKAAEKQLSEKTRFTETLLDLNPDSIYIYDLINRSNVYSNNGTQRILGYSVEEIQAMGNTMLPSLMHPDDFEVYNASTVVRYRQAKDGELIGHQFRMKHKNGEWRWLQSAETIYTRRPDGSPSHIFGVIHDMTDLKRATDVLVNTQKLEALGVLAGGIAHDFNNLLGGIFGTIDLAAEETKEKNVADYLKRAISTIDRARALTGQLLTFAKGGAPIKKIDRLVPFIEETAKFALSGSNVTCRFDIPDKIWPCDYDKNQIGQVIDNIVINAQQAMPEGGIIEVTAKNLHLVGKSHATLPAGGYVKIAFKDFGIGMPKEILPKIFDPFYTTKAKGHGLGLATSYSIIKRHGGCIEVDSEPGKGSLFTVYLPASPEALAADATAATAVHHGSGSILIMDDEEVIRDTVGSMLTSMGYDVLCVSNSKEATEAFQRKNQGENRFTALVLDLTIPGGPGGKEVIGELRKLDKEIPAFVASGYADDPVMSNPTEYGFNGSLCKPFRKADLAELLNKHLNKTKV